MTNSVGPVALDDDALRELAEEPEQRLFPLLGQAEAMVPLVIVLAFLPALYAVENRTLTEAGARAGLTSVHWLASRGLSGAVEPAALEPSSLADYQPPLMTWLTAFGMFAFGARSAAGFIAPAYLATTGLIIAGYILARRMGGEKLGLVTAALLAFNPSVLAGAQEPLPQSLAGMLAMLSLAGVIAHWQKSATVTSYQLLLGGLALGGCLLAGGPAALAVVLSVLLYILWWKLDGRIRRRSGLVWDRGQFHRRTAFRSAGILIATGFAVGGWHLMLMSSRHGRAFWQAWINTGAAQPASGSTTGPFSFFECVRELNQFTLPLLMLALVGFIGIARDWYRAEEDTRRQFRGLLPVWTAVALVAWILSGPAARSSASGPGFQGTLLAIPLVIAAAMGLIEIIERRVAFLAAVAVALLTLANVALLADWPPAGFLTDYAIVPKAIRGAGILFFGFVCGIALVRFSGRHEYRRRIVLTAMLLVVLCANSVWGALAVRRTNQGDRELEVVQTAAARLTRVAQCTFVSLSPRDIDPGAQPPAQLTFLMARLWPGAGTRITSSWDEALSPSAESPSPAAPAVQVFVAWSPRGGVRGSPPAAGLRSAAPPFHYRDVEIVLYVREEPVGGRSGGE
jgi:hypothetical protein